MDTTTTKIEKEVFDKLSKACKEDGRTKVWLASRLLDKALELYKTGKIKV